MCARGEAMTGNFRQWALFVILLLFVSAGFAQTRATLTGTIFDPSGAVVHGAKVELDSTETGLHREVLSSETGSYTFAGVPIGNYNIILSFQGFRTITVRNVRLSVGDRRTEDIAFTEVAG